MRERDMNCTPKEGELHRLKDILFPKKVRSRVISQTEQPHQTNPDNGLWIRSQISRLRGQIYCMMQKGKTNEGLALQTERAYLNGINHLSKNLKHYTCQINEAFDDFVTHLPTTALHKKNYSNSYYLSMLIQNSTWTRIEQILKRPLAHAFHQLRTENLQQRQEDLKLQRKQLECRWKIKNKLFENASKYFNRWRYHSTCLKLNLKSEQYLQEHNLQHDRKIEQSLLNLPLLALILEQLAAETADVSQLLVVDQKRTKACKFIEHGQSHLNSHIETVTQRSILQTADAASRKFSRFQFSLTPSLTKTCLERGQILFVSNLAKNIDYSQIDNACLWQIETKSYSYLKGGAVFYPLFDSHSQCIGLLRQYFHEIPIKSLPPAKIEKIRMLLELGMGLQKKMISLSRQRQYQKQGYYLKMISLIKRMETAKGRQSEIMSILFEQLQSKLGIQKLCIYKVERIPAQTEKKIMLKSLYGESQQGNLLLSMVGQLMRQQQSHVYLQNRILIYCKLTLFDLQLPPHEQLPSATDKQHKPLPVQLIVNVMSKVHALLAIKGEQFKTIQSGKEQTAKQLRIAELKQLDEQVKNHSIQLLTNLDQDTTILRSIAAYLQIVWTSLTKFHLATTEAYRSPVFYLQTVSGKSRREKSTFHMDAEKQETTEIQRSELCQHSSSCIKIALSQLTTLFIDFPLGEGLKYLDCISMTVSQYINNYYHLAQQSKAKTWKFNDIVEQFNYKIRALRFPEKQAYEHKKCHELGLIKTIYSSFHRAVSLFCQHYFETSEEPIWQRPQPSVSNMQEWKQFIYKNVLSDPALTQVDIRNQNAVLPLQEYEKIGLIMHSQVEFVKRQSWLVLGNAGLRRAKQFGCDEQLTLKLPVYFYFQNQQTDSQSREAYVREGLESLKSIWLKFCSSLLQFNRVYNESSLLLASAKTAVTVQKLKSHKLLHSFALLNKVRLLKKRSIKSAQIFLSTVQNYQKSIIVFSLSKMLAHSDAKRVLKTKHYLSKANIQLLSSKCARPLFADQFQRLKTVSWKKKRIQQGLKNIHKLHQAIQIETQQEIFTDILYFTRRYTRTNIVAQTINTIVKFRLNLSFQKLLREGSKTAVAVLQKDVFGLETSRSLKQISLQIRHETPFYSLYLVINEDSCYTLYNPKGSSYEPIPTDQVYSSAPPNIIYQIGSHSQLVWVYFVDPASTCFQIKDKLNSLSKCIEAALQNCREEMQIRLTSLSTIKRSFTRNLKVNYWKKWREQSAQLAMEEQNRLNDSLYQISLESQTMKEKLKGQEKALKNNFASFQELQRKQEEYKSSITHNSTEVRRIDEAHRKLQNARGLSKILHRRTVVKSCFLLWRTNSLLIKLAEIQKKRVQNSPYVKIALNSILTIHSNWYHTQFGSVLLKLRSYGRQLKTKQIQKLSVSFEENGQRLITFQSNSIEQENSSRQSNSMQSSEYSQDSLHKFKLQKMQHQKTIGELSAEQMSRYNNGAYKLNSKTLKFLKRMGKLQN